MLTQIDCQACRTPGAMTATKIPRFSGVVRVIGVIILIPSFIGMGAAGLFLLSTIVTGVNMPAAKSEAEQTGQAVAFGIMGFMALIVAGAALVSGLVGWLLLLNKKVFRCNRCGFVMNRA